MRVNEIFYSIQGEGRWTGTPAIFVRLAGCNLRCPFCDTNHEQGEEMTEEEIVKRVQEFPAHHVILTGGEPSLQLTESLITRLHEADKYVAIETNGTHPLPLGIDWVTLSPKFEFCKNGLVRIDSYNELKIVYNGQNMSIYDDLASKCSNCYIQPCDTYNQTTNENILAESIQFIQSHPKWKLSLQTQKILNVQ